MPKRTEISAFHHTLKVLKDWSKLSSSSFRGQKLHKNRPRKKNWNKCLLRNSESIFWYFLISKAGRFQNNFSRELLKSKRSLRKLLKNTRGKAKIETSGEKADREDSKQEEGQEGWQVETQPETIRDEADTSSKSKKGKKEDKKRDKKPKKRGNNQREDVRNGFALENIDNPTQESTRYPCFSNPFWTQSTWLNSTEYVPSRFSLGGPLLFSVLCPMFCFFVSASKIDSSYLLPCFL